MEEFSETLNNYSHIYPSTQKEVVAFMKEEVF